MILIVDDKQENLFSLQKLLQLHDFKVDTALSGEEALKKILKNFYALIILDVQMPVMDGFEVAEAISGYGKSKDIPIIFLSAVKINKTFITKGYDSGGIDYVTKPFDPDVLLLKVKTFYRLSEQRRALNEMQNILKEEIEFRKKAEKDLSDLNHSLEKRVEERTEELFKINKQLEISNDDLQQYASVASHDLKEPLRKIQIYSDKVRRSFLNGNDEADQYMQKIIASSQRMSRLINDLLNYSRLSGEGLFKRTNINTILDELMSDLEILIAEKNASIYFDKFPEMDVIPGQIRQLFQNMLSNAIKFSKPGVAPEITITVRRTEQLDIDSADSENGNYARISISDNGIGFNEIYKEKIFTMFQRLHSREAFEGTGIGLAIVKKIVEKHNGIITVNSREGEGTNFTFVLPILQNKPVAEKELSAI
ncbi:MAG: response regulator [Chitinophagaceae bacterium]|nr:response regulator [Chitinophagaceae bacterium]